MEPRSCTLSNSAGASGARWIAIVESGERPKANSKWIGLPIVIVCGDVLKPAAQVGPQILDLRLPYARDRGRKILLGTSLLPNRVRGRRVEARQERGRG